MTLFGTDGIRGPANKGSMTAETMLQVGKALGQRIYQTRKNGRPKVIIGKDTRLSGYIFEFALTSGLCSVGCDVLLVGPMPTPAVAHLTKSFAADAGIVISASHNTFTDNGIKVFNADGFKLSREEEGQIEALVKAGPIASSYVTGADIGKAFRINDAAGRYIEFAKASIASRSLKGIKLVIDCANGAAYQIASTVFSELGAQVTLLANRPDGLNINNGCGALHPELVTKAVLEQKADCGIAFDGDADRVIMVDEK
ncbi:phosphoglucosamine mutase, partial [Candidatus Woesearchaeota archaeon CG_4_10_14_0_2_um_filter_57_5]